MSGKADLTEGKTRWKDACKGNQFFTVCACSESKASPADERKLPCDEVEKIDRRKPKSLGRSEGGRKQYCLGEIDLDVLIKLSHSSFTTFSRSFPKQATQNYTKTYAARLKTSAPFVLIYLR